MYDAGREAIDAELATTRANAFQRITREPFESEPGEVLPRLERNLRAKGYL